MDRTDSQDSLLTEIQLHIEQGDITLSSGQKSTWYVDLRRISLRWPRAVAQAVEVQIARAGVYSPYLAAGVMLGGVPIATGLACVNNRVAALAVRAEPKEHGKKSIIEGPTELIGSRSLVIIDDTLTSGRSLGFATEAFRKHYNVEPNLYCVVVNRHPHLQDATSLHGIPFTFLYGLEDLGV